MAATSEVRRRTSTSMVFMMPTPPTSKRAQAHDDHEIAEILRNHFVALEKVVNVGGADARYKRFDFNGQRVKRRFVGRLIREKQRDAIRRELVVDCGSRIGQVEVGEAEEGVQKSW